MIHMLEGATADQRSVITFKDGRALVLAGPGSGKTGVITSRIGYLMDHWKVPSSRILTVTFTTSAAAEMQRRATERFPQAAEAVFGTFHSVFYQIIRSSGYYQGFTFLSPYEQKQIIEAVIRHFPTDNDIIQKDPAALLSDISYQKNTGKERGQGSRFFAAYTQECRLRGKLDFDDILLFCRELLWEKSEVRQFWQKRFSYLQIDEFQDINLLQYEIMSLLAEECGNLVAVGDDDQAIYSFRGSDPSLMKRFEQEGDVKRITLSRNFRCDPAIADAAQISISHNGERFEKRSVSEVKESRGEVLIEHYESAAGEGKGILECLKGYDLQREKVAILVRTNREMENYASLLIAAGIPFFIREKRRKLYELESVRDFAAFIRFLHGSGERSALLRFMNKPQRGLLRGALSERRVDIDRVASGLYERGLTEAARDWEKFAGQLAFARSLDLFAAKQYFFKTMGYESYIRSLEEKEREEGLEGMAFLEGFEGTTKPAEFLEQLRSYEKSFLQQPDQKSPLPGNGIMIMTYHGAKGLEFDRVLLPGVCDGAVPKGRGLTGEQLAEERRMFYVAMTRARHTLLISWYGVESRLSLFVKELQPYISSNSRLSRYSSKASITASNSSSSSMSESSGSSLGSSGFSL